MNPWWAARNLSTDMTANYGGLYDLSSQAAVVNAPTRSLSVQDTLSVLATGWPGSISAAMSSVCRRDSTSYFKDFVVQSA